MLKVKPEGEQFSRQDWQPPHPARWCLLKYLWTVLRTGNLYGPYGQAWQHDSHVWTCYMRFRGPWSGAHTWRQILFEHYHHDFCDIVQMANSVNDAEDPFLGAKYEVMVHYVEGDVFPWKQEWDRRFS
jgi:hypothetical protein